MSYTINENMPKLRQRAAELVSKGWSARKVGRYLGFHHTAVMKWVRKSRKIGYHPIPTRSSRPDHHPRQLDQKLVKAIIEKRLAVKRSAEVVHQELLNEHVSVSLSSVKRTLDRNHMLNKRNPWKRYHPPMDRPVVEKPGHLERFNRTIQEECLRGIPNNVIQINKVLPGYLAHYNTKRLHFGINLKVPMQMVP